MSRKTKEEKESNAFFNFDSPLVKVCTNCKWYGIATCEYPGHCTEDSKVAFMPADSATVHE